jgi:hypothetical protein
MILLLTLRAHRKAMHRSIGTVIGQTPDNGIARATVGAVNKGVAEAAVFGIEKLATAITAKRNIRRNKCLDFGAGARIPDYETILNKARVRSSIASMYASGGNSPRKRRENSSRRAGGPCTSIKTPDAVLRVKPLRPDPTARQ